jgi:hypothetical protein
MVLVHDTTGVEAHRGSSGSPTLPGKKLFETMMSPVAWTVYRVV